MSPFLSVHIAVLRAKRHTIAVLGFLFIILLTAMGFSGFLDTGESALQTGWLILLFYAYATLYLFIAADRGRSEYFRALGYWPQWCRTQITAHFIVQMTFILIWAIFTALVYDSTYFALQQAGLMALFSLIFSQSTLSSLQFRVIGLTEFKKLALITVISAPWALCAWLTGTFAARAAQAGTSSLMLTGILILLGIFQCLINRSDAPACTKCKKQNKP